MSLTTQLEALAKAREVGSQILPADQVEQLDMILQKASSRRALSADHTTVGLFGATGSGKSSLFNSLTGHEFATTGLIRPTTSRTSAAVWRPDGASPLLDWLEVQEVWTAPSVHSTPLILLDLPDFDSISGENREVVNRLVGQVDVLVWVVDPQKYADRVIHRDYIRPLAHQSSVTVAVLNQIDQLSPSARTEILASFRGLLDDAGLSSVRIFPVSAKTGEGIDNLWGALEELAENNTASSERLSHDVSVWVQQALPGQVTGRNKTQNDRMLVQQVGTAAGINTIANDVAASYRKRSGEATGWFFTSWLSRFSPDPLKRLRVETTGDFPTRTSLPPRSAASQALLSTSVRDYGNQVAGDLPQPWRHIITDQTPQVIDDLSDSLDRAVGSIPYRADRSWWWPLAGALQWVASVLVVLGLGWYLAAWATAALGLPLVPISKFDGWPVPGMLVAFGMLFGLSMGLAFMLWGRTVARMRRRAARRALQNQVADVVQKTVIIPTEEVAAQAQELRELLITAAG